MSLHSYVPEIASEPPAVLGHTGPLLLNPPAFKHHLLRAPVWTPRAQALQFNLLLALHKSVLHHAHPYVSINAAIHIPREELFLAGHQRDVAEKKSR